VSASASGPGALHIVVLSLLSGLVVFLWVRAGRRSAIPI
jgi:hypothetical protein